MATASDKVALAQLSEKVKTIIGHLYDLELTASDFPAEVAPDALQEHIRRLVDEYSELEAIKSSTGIDVPQDVLEYIEAGRNPNVYTRQFSEAVARESQSLHGKMAAHEDFAVVLGGCIERQIPDLGAQVGSALQEKVVVQNKHV